MQINSNHIFDYRTNWELKRASQCNGGDDDDEVERDKTIILTQQQQQRAADTNK